MAKKDKWTKRQWISWGLQCSSYCVGIALGIKELFYRKPMALPSLKHLERDDVFKRMPIPDFVEPSVDWIYLGVILVVLVAVTFGMRYIRRKSAIRN